MQIFPTAPNTEIVMILDPTLVGETTRLGELTSLHKTWSQVEIGSAAL